MRAAFAELARAAGRGRLVTPENLHLTLAFLGFVGDDRIACVEDAGARVHGRAFSLSFTSTGYFARPRVLWSGCQEVPEALRGLVAELWAALGECGIEPEHREFRAHVTLARKVGKGVVTGVHSPVVWPVRSFCLIESRTLPEGARYEVRARWDLVPA